MEKVPFVTSTLTVDRFVPVPIEKVTVRCGSGSPEAIVDRTGELVDEKVVSKLPVKFLARADTVTEYDPFEAAFDAVAVTTDSLLDEASLLTPPPDSVVKPCRLERIASSFVSTLAKAVLVSSRSETLVSLGVTRDFRVAALVASINPLVSIPDAIPEKLMVDIVACGLPEIELLQETCQV
jgi:hypothetical protein